MIENVKLLNSIDWSDINPAQKEILKEKLSHIILQNIEDEALDMLGLNMENIIQYKSYSVELIQLLTTSKAREMFSPLNIEEMALMLKKLYLFFDILDDEDFFRILEIRAMLNAWSQQRNY